MSQSADWTEAELDQLEAAQAHQQELEARQREEDQATLSADPFYVRWLDIINAESEQ